MRLVLLCLSTLWLVPNLTAVDVADLVLRNGKVWTENPAQPAVEAVAITGGRIVEAGSAASIRHRIGPETKVIELHGRRVVPGFNDAHVHFYTGGASLASVQLRDARSEAEFKARIGAYARSRPKGEWILNGSWDHENWTPVRLPEHGWI